MLRKRIIIERIRIRVTGILFSPTNFPQILEIQILLRTLEISKLDK